MVFLRLTIKVYPRDQLQSSSSFSLRSILGDRDRDESNRSSSTAGNGKPVSFMLVLEHPEGITLGGLSSIIQDKWKKLRPNAEPLQIKKLLDDSYESDDLDVDMTVADVFVDNGRARADGGDQRGTVRVIQKPAPYAPVRFPSVTQDWDAAADEFEQQIKNKREAVEKFPTILEEPQQTPDAGSPDGRWRASSVHDQGHAKESPLPSTEREEIPGSPQEWAGKSLLDDANVRARRGSTVAPTPQQKRMESQELGDWPSSLSIPVHQGQQSTASPKFTDAEALADESFLSSPEESHDEQNSEPTSTTRKASSQTGHGPELPPIEEASQGYQTSGSDREQAVPQQDEQQDEPHDEDDDEEVDEEDDEDDDEDDDDEDDEESSSDDQSGEESAVEMDMNPTEERRDGDGDITMTGSASKRKQEFSGAPRNAADDPVATEAAEAEGPVFSSRLGKRKKSMDHLTPNKEPRLGQFGSHAASSQDTSGDRADPEKPVTPASSPSASRKGERTPSFSGLARRLSFSERPELPQQGLGLGITKSPPSKEPVIYDLSRDPEQSSKQLPRDRTPSSSAPIPRWGSAFQAQSTPSNPPARSPGITPKQLHSALRKGSPAERPPERRSVSFADDDISIINSKSTPRSTSENTTKPLANTSSERRRSGPGSMVYPPSVAADEIEKIESKAEKERLAMLKRESEQLKELKQKLKAAEKQGVDAKYRRKLEEACRTLGAIENYENASGKKPHSTLKRLRGKYETLRGDIEGLEASPKSKTLPRGDWKAVNSADNPPASKNATAKTQKSPHTTPQSQSRATTSAPKAATPESSVKPRHSQANQPVTKGPTVSRATDDDDTDLPSVKAAHRTGFTSRSNATTVNRSAPKKSETIVITSSESESESDSDSDESDSEGDDQPPPKKVDSSQRANVSKAQARAGASATPSRVTSSPVWPRQPNSSQTRPSLKSIKADQKKVQQEKLQSSRSNAQRRSRDVFDGPLDSDDSESDDSESEDSDSDDGDIQSSGRVGKLSAARRR